MPVCPSVPGATRLAPLTATLATRLPAWSGPLGRRPRLLLEIDFSDDLLDERPEDLVGRLRARNRPTVPAVVAALAEAAADPDVAGLVARVGARRLSWARAAELRGAVSAFAAAGKAATCYAEEFGASAAYLLATGFPQIWLLPIGELHLTGVAAQVPFLRRALDRLSVQPQIGQRHEYKGAADTFVRDGFTAANREATQRIVDSLGEALMSSVAEARQIEPDRVRELIDRAPLSGPEALAAGLVDRLGYRDEVYDDLRQRLGADLQLRFLDRYHRRRPPPAAARRALVRRRSRGVALVRVTGTIRQGRSGRGPLGGVHTGSDTVAAALRAAGRDPHVAAVVLRVNSPGGSAVASEVIWREVVRIQRDGTPVVVSMGDLAASGGYYVSCAAHAILAEPGTVTGSIGVLSGKLVTAELLARLGITVEAAAVGRHARMFSPNREFEESEWARLGEMLDRVYAEFVRRVADGRRLSVADVERVARGRVWTGADALGHRLVDALGGLRDAADLARSAAGLPAEAPLQPYPHLPLPARLRPPRSSDDPRAAAAQAAGWSAEVRTAFRDGATGAFASGLGDAAAVAYVEAAFTCGSLADIALLTPPLLLG